MEDKKYPNVLIISPVPYSTRMTSRCLNSYFNGWPKENLAHIFSYAKQPTKGHCKYFYQITDEQLLKRLFSKKIIIGKEYNDENLDEEWENSNLEVENSFFNSLYVSAKRKSSYKYLFRKWIWKKKYWYTNNLKLWINRFKPDIIFVMVSDYTYPMEIALQLSNDLKIPIVTCILDDYLFNNKFSLSLLYYLYRYQYKKIMKKIFMKTEKFIYISDKMKKKYEDIFKISGETIFLSSEKLKQNFPIIERRNPIFSYFGNISLGRNYSLVDIAEALNKINEEYFVDVYSNEINKRYILPLIKCKSIRFHGGISYDEVIKKTKESNFLILVEGTKKKHYLDSRYSLSTKTADALSSNIPIIAYGGKDCGLIEYIKEKNAGCVITKKEEYMNVFWNL